MNLNELIGLIDSPNREKCYKLNEDNKSHFELARGSSFNHQAWPGGYLDHIVEVMNVAVNLYGSLSTIRELPFTLSDSLLILFLHDLEKPWKNEIHFQSKNDKRLFRTSKIKQYEIELSAEQENALRYVEGEGDDYRSDRRVMNELSAFCHICDVTSARIWHDKPGK
jgi:hypothetical protein